MLTPGTFFDAIAGFIRSFPGYGLKLYGRDSGSIALSPPVNSDDQVYTLPDALPVSDDQVLSSDVGGQTTWVNLPVVSFEFQYDNVTVLPLRLIKAGEIVLRTDLALLTAFNGTSPSLSVGDSSDHNRLLAASSVDPSIAATFIASSKVKFLVDTQVNLYISPGAGASQGSGVVSLTLE